jgi:hypothetical protein
MLSAKRRSASDQLEPAVLDATATCRRTFEKDNAA